jgi:hypothetical protein
LSYEWIISKWVHGSISVISNPVLHFPTRMISELTAGTTPKHWMQKILYDNSEMNFSSPPSKI